MTNTAIRQICNKYSQKYNCTYQIRNSKTTSSVYIKFYFENGKHLSVRLANHRQYGSKISSVKPTADKLENLLKNKFKKYGIYKVLSFLEGETNGNKKSERTRNKQC